jgi:hypothetical protein
MENLWVFLADCPGAVHELMKYLTANHHALLDFYEKENLLTSTSGNSDIGQSSYGFTSRLPSKAPGTYTLKDVWMFTEMEETSSVSPEMFREFFLPCNESLCSRVGAVYYGCCEPMQNTFPAIYKAIPNLRKLSISAFSDEQKMGELLQNTGIVYSRKPRPNYLGVAKSLDEEAWCGHIADTFRAARGSPCEIIRRGAQVLFLDFAYFIPEIAAPLIKCFWKNRNTMVTGSIIRAAAARQAETSTVWAPLVK